MVSWVEHGEVDSGQWKTRPTNAEAGKRQAIAGAVESAGDGRLAANALAVEDAIGGRKGDTVTLPAALQPQLTPAP